jgi:hypothetical protein
MSIDSKCFQELQKIGLPMDVELVDKSQTVVACATINLDGTVYCSTNKKTYDCPSLFRDELLGSNLPTYPNLRITGQIQSLRDMGVKRR